MCQSKIKLCSPAIGTNCFERDDLCMLRFRTEEKHFSEIMQSMENATEQLNTSVGPTAFRGKIWQIPRRNLVNSAAHRGKADEIPRLTAVTQLNFLNQQVKYMLLTYESFIIHSLIIIFIIQPSPSNKKSS